MVGAEGLGKEGDPAVWWGEVSCVEFLVGVSVSGRSFDLRSSVPWGRKIRGRGRLKNDVVQEMARKVKEVLLHSHSCMFFHLFECLHECCDGVEGGGAERGVCLDCSLRGHVVLGPLEEATWLCIEHLR